MNAYHGSEPFGALGQVPAQEKQNAMLMKTKLAFGHNV